MNREGRYEIYLVLPDLMERIPSVGGVSKGFTINFLTTLLAECEKFAPAIEPRSKKKFPPEWKPTVQDSDASYDELLRQRADLSVAIFASPGRPDFCSCSVRDHIKNTRNILIFTPPPKEVYITEWLDFGMQGGYVSPIYDHSISRFETPEAARIVAVRIAETLVEKCGLPEDHEVQRYATEQRRLLDEADAENKPGRPGKRESTYARWIRQGVVVAEKPPSEGYHEEYGQNGPCDVVLPENEVKRLVSA